MSTIITIIIITMLYACSARTSIIHTFRQEDVTIPLYFCSCNRRSTYIHSTVFCCHTRVHICTDNRHTAVYITELQLCRFT